MDYSFLGDTPQQRKFTSLKKADRFDFLQEQMHEKTRKKNLNSTLIAKYKVKGVLFNHLLARISGKTTSGLFMSQILYWNDKGMIKGWIYKTIKEVTEETLLTRSEQSRAIKRWTELGVLVVKKKGLPQKRHFQVNTERLIELLDECAAKLQNPK